MMFSFPLTPHRATHPTFCFSQTKAKKDTKPPQKCKNKNLNKEAKDQQDEKKTTKTKVHENMLSLF